MLRVKERSSIASVTYIFAHEARGEIQISFCLLGRCRQAKQIPEDSYTSHKDIF